MSYLKNLIRTTGNEFASIVEEGVAAADVSGYIDTGSYIFNALLSGSIYDGLPDNKITALAGESATGKTFFALGMCKQFLEDNADAAVIYFESESATSKKMIEERGIDSSRIMMVPVTTVQEFRTQAIRILDQYMEDKTDMKMLFVLDSLGMLSTTKESADTTSGAETRDMTRAQLVKGAFRVLTLKLAKAGVALVVTNHTYDQMGLFAKRVMGGGSGLKYAASSILFLSRKKEKEGTEVIGNIVHCKNEKSRLTVENRVVDVMLTYKKGLSRYYGLIDLAIKYGIFKKSSTRVELPDGTTQFAKTINNNPKKYFTTEVLDKLNEVAKQEFLYGNETRTDDTQESDNE